MTTSQNKIWAVGAVIAALMALVTVVGVFASETKANPSAFLRSTSSSTVFTPATTSPAYMTPGTATTTLAYDLAAGGAKGVDSATLLVQYAGPGGINSVLNIDIQYAQGNGQDCTLNPSPCDWYAMSGGWNSNISIATTSPSLGGVEQYTFPFASSTINRIAVTNANSATSTRSVLVNTPTRYVRAVFSQGGTANGAVWAEWVAKQQTP